MSKRNEFDVQKLNQMQWYLGEEMIEDWQEGQLTRRKMLKRLIYITGSSAGAAALLSACGQPVTAPPPTAVPATAVPPTAAPAAKAPDATKAPAPPTPSGPGVLSVPESDPAVSGETITYDTDVKVTAYLAKPKAPGNYPGVVVIHENRGLNPHIRDVARRLAKAGFIAIAPDLVSRGGGTDALGNDKVPGWLSSAKVEELVKDMNGAVDVLKKQAGIGKLGVVGFCFGGAQTIHLAAANESIVAAVPYYGPVPNNTVKPLESIKAAMMPVYAGNDTRVNGTADALETAMKGKTYKKMIYDGVNHAFNNDTGGAYNEAAASRAWVDTLTWFTTHLK